MGRVCLFEDDACHGFYPVSETRHVSELLVGGRTLCERARSLFTDSELLLTGRPEILQHVPEENRLASVVADSHVIFLNSRVLPTQSLADQMPEEGGWIVRDGGMVIAASIPHVDIPALFTKGWIPDFGQIGGLRPVEMQGIHYYSWLWDLLADNDARIAEDAVEYFSEEQLPDFEGVHVVNPNAIAVASGATISPGVVLDATDGPIVIDSGVRVMSGSILMGPCFVGSNSTIKAGARIYGGTSIGPWSKIGGEVENSIILGYSNKQHEGFLGHSYLGSWVNLGADTNTSDLKNNYGTISVDLPTGRVETGRMMLGSLIGDHSKTSINTMLNTGSVIGVFANIFGAGFPPKEVPSFYWGGSEGGDLYRFEAAIVVAERVMARRNIPFTPEDRELLRTIFERRNNRSPKGLE